MNPLPSRVNQHQVLLRLRHEDVLEHAMRLCRDELLVVDLAQFPRASKDFMAALGRLLEACPAAAARGLPIALWASGSSDGLLSPGWRSQVVADPSSLWAELEFLLSLSGASSWAATSPDPLAALLVLRQAR